MVSSAKSSSRKRERYHDLMEAYASHLLGVRRPSRTPDTAHTEVVRHSGVDFGNKCAGMGGGSQFKELRGALRDGC